MDVPEVEPWMITSAFSSAYVDQITRLEASIPRGTAGVARLTEIIIKHSDYYFTVRRQKQKDNHEHEKNRAILWFFHDFMKRMKKKKKKLDSDQQEKIKSMKEDLRSMTEKFRAMDRNSARMVRNLGNLKKRLGKCVRMRKEVNGMVGLCNKNLEKARGGYMDQCTNAW